VLPHDVTAAGAEMTDISNDEFNGFDENAYQHQMHTLANISLWTIIILGVACGLFGFVWGLTH
jgi:hypothetical protein